MIHTPLSTVTRKNESAEVATPVDFPDISAPLREQWAARPVHITHESPPCAHGFFYGASRPTRATPLPPTRSTRFDIVLYVLAACLALASAALVVFK